MLHLRIIDGVPRYVAREAERFVSLVQLVVRVEHAVLVDVVPAFVVTDPQGRHAFGLFYFERYNEPSIAVAGDLRPIVAKHGRGEALEMFRDTLAHELAHYEQWRDGRKVQERGVNVRAKSIVRKVAAKR